jgi:hypothetical protein
MCQSGGIAVFNYGQFLSRYAAFSKVPQSSLQAYFDEAGALYLINQPISPVPNVVKRLWLLYMLVAHLSFLNGDLSADGQARPVGRISQASEGSVSASLEMGPPSGSSAWFNQSQYGAAFWQATLYLRSARYVTVPGVGLRA